MFNNLEIIYVESARSPVILIKIILNSTEWEITLHLYEFDDSWMRYAKGRRSTRIILNLLLQNYILNSQKIYRILIKETLMVKIGHSSMSGAFEPTRRDWSGDLASKSTLDIIEEYFDGNWREGQEIHEVVITQRLYQTSPNSKQA